VHSAIFLGTPQDALNFFEKAFDIEPGVQQQFL
jgi:hypothetical protein